MHVRTVVSAPQLGWGHMILSKQEAFLNQPFDFHAVFDEEQFRERRSLTRLDHIRESIWAGVAE